MSEGPNKRQGVRYLTPDSILIHNLYFVNSFSIISFINYTYVIGFINIRRLLSQLTSSLDKDEISNNTLLFTLPLFYILPTSPKKAAFVPKTIRKKLAFLSLMVKLNNFLTIYCV